MISEPVFVSQRVAIIPKLHALSKGPDRNSIKMISLDQMVADDNFAYIIDQIVDAKPIEELGFEHTKLN
ncbi:MAG: hypothetical protein KJN66_10555 [Bacteroidia bacterium]|nr:hypothetical protein [Bacteroidia bacterium]